MSLSWRPYWLTGQIATTKIAESSTTSTGKPTARKCASKLFLEFSEGRSNEFKGRADPCMHGSIVNGLSCLRTSITCIVDGVGVQNLEGGRDRGHCTHRMTNYFFFPFFKAGALKWLDSNCWHDRACRCPCTDFEWHWRKQRLVLLSSNFVFHF